MPDLSDLVPFYSGQGRNWTRNYKKLIECCISYFENSDVFMENNVDSDQLKKPADLDLHCLQ